MRLTRSQLYLLLALLTVAVGVVTNVATNQMPTWIQPYLWISWPILGVLALLFIILSVYQAREEPLQSPRSPTSSGVEEKILDEPADEDQQHLQDLIATKRRRLHALEIQEARFGLYVPAHIKVEIEDLHREIANLEVQLPGTAE